MLLEHLLKVKARTFALSNHEQALIQKSLDGDTSCFEQLVLCYEKRLIRFLRLRCHCQNDADDIFQETFLNAHLHLHSYSPRYAFSTWLFNIAMNLVKKLYKNNHDYSNQDSIQVEVYCNQDTTPNIWFTAKKVLTSEQLSLLWFFYVEEYTGKQVAYLLDRSLAWVKINLIRTKAMLKQALTEQNLKLSDLLSNQE